MSQLWETERTTVARAFYESAKIDLEAGLLLFNEEQYKYFFNSIISFCLALEKLLKASLYVRSPLLLKMAINPTDVISLAENPMAFGQSFIRNQQANFVGLEGAWKRLEQYQDQKQLKDFSTLFNDLSTYRNHHVHTFAKIPSRITMKQIFVELWKLLEHLYEDSSSKMSNSDSNVLDDMLEANLLNKLVDLRNEFQVSVDFVTEQKELADWLDTEQPVTVASFIEHLGASWSGESEVTEVECPFCRKTSGVTGMILHPEYRENSEGDTVVWEEPSAFSAKFMCFGCMSCGAFADSESVIEAMEADPEEVKPDYFSFRWGLDDGISDIKAVRPDRKGGVWGMEVMWF